MVEPVETSLGQGESLRMRALRKIASSVPVANSRIASGYQAARDMQLQKAVQAAKPAQATTQVAQQVGTAQAQAAGQQTQQLAQQVARTQAQIGQQVVQEQGRSLEAERALTENRLAEQKLRDTQRLTQLSEKAKKEMLDDRLRFERDEMGRLLLNERQLADFAVGKARNAEEFANYQQASTQAYQRKEQAFRTASARIEAELKRAYQLDKQYQDQLSAATTKGMVSGADQARAKKQADLIVDLEMKKMILEDSLRETQAQKANSAARNSAIMSTVFTVAGAVVGGYFGGAGGAAAGGAAGGAIGSGLGGLTG